MKRLILVCVILFCALSASTAAWSDLVVRGVAVSETGAKISGARVTLLSDSNLGLGAAVLGRAISGMDGAFKLVYKEPRPTIFPSSLYLVVTSGDRLGIESVRNGKATQRIVCGKMGDISGVVKDSDGHPVPGAVVEPQFFTRNSFFGQQYIDYGSLRTAVGIQPATTDAEGKFTVSGLPSGWNTLLIARKEGFQVAGADKIQSSVFDSALPAGSAGASIELQTKLPEGKFGRIEGRVFDSSTGKSFSGLIISTAMESESDGTGVRTVVTDSNGRFNFGKLKPGSYTVWVGESDKPVQPDTGVKVKEYAATSVVLRAVEGTPVEGKVVDSATGKGVPGVLALSPGSRPARTDKDGRFSYRALPGPGVVAVYGGSAGYEDATREMNIPGTGKVSGLVMKLSRALKVTGKILSSSALNGVNGALVRIMTPDGPSDLVQADSVGNYEILLDPSYFQAKKECHIIAIEPSTNAGAVKKFNLQPGKDNRIDLNLRPSAVVSGTVKGEDGKPIPGARITPMLELGKYRVPSLHSQVSTDELGKFTIGNLVAGANYIIRISAPGYKPLDPGDDKLPNLKSGKNPPVDFVLSKLP